MKLLYLYIRDYGILQDIEFNFDSEHKYHFDKSTRVLSSQLSQSPLPEDFFSINKKGDDRVIESISAIIGNNGAGKTSVARFLHDLSRRRDFEYILIWEKKNRLKYDYFIVPEILAQGEFDDSKNVLHTEDKQLQRVTNSSFGSLPFNADFIYCSNFYMPRHGIGTINDITDISTSYLMKNDDEGYVNLSAGASSNIDKIDAHDFKDLQRNVQFFAEYNKRAREVECKNALWELPKPIGVVVSVNNVDSGPLKQFVEKMIHPDLESSNDKDKSLSKKMDGRLFSLERVVFDILNKLDTFTKSNLDFTLNSMSSFFANYTRYHIINHNVQDNIKNSYGPGLTTLLSALEKSDDPCQSLRAFFNEIDKIAPTRIQNALKLFDYVKQKNTNNDKLYFDIQNDKENFLNFFNLYLGSKTITDFFNFSWDPYISAGEYAQLNIYSRLYSLIGYNNLKTDLIVFMDEVEITVHPGIQSELVSNLIKFFEMFFAGHKVHIFFASHSPVLLSDIPKSNVCFIERDDDIVKIVEPKIDNTFGANIHSLYRHSFFMKNGTMGALASAKINDIIDKINKAVTDDQIKTLNKDKNSIQKLIDLIGEPIIKSSIKNLFEDKLKSVIELNDIDNQIEHHRKMLTLLEKQKQHEAESL